MSTGFILMQVYVFVLACFAGFQLISKVPPTLHTPLMSGSNAISGITVLGCMVLATPYWGEKPAAHIVFSTIVAMVAAIFAMINVVGGFAVTHRMLLMFKKKD